MFKVSCNLFLIRNYFQQNAIWMFQQNLPLHLHLRNVPGFWHLQDVSLPSGWGRTLSRLSLTSCRPFYCVVLSLLRCNVYSLLPYWHRCILPCPFLFGLDVPGFINVLDLSRKIVLIFKMFFFAVELFVKRLSNLDRSFRVCCC